MIAKCFRFNMTSESKDKGTEFKLHLLLPLKDDNGTYKIVLESLTGRAESSAKLRVLSNLAPLSNVVGSAEQTLLLPLPIWFVQPLTDKVVKVGETAILEVEIYRTPTVVKWYKNGKEIIGQSVTMSKNKFCSKIPNAGKDDDAKYTVRNKTKNCKNAHFKLIVSDENGQSVGLNCKLTVIQPEEAVCTQVVDLVKSLNKEYESISLILYL